MIFFSQKFLTFKLIFIDIKKGPKMITENALRSGDKKKKVYEQKIFFMIQRRKLFFYAEQYLKAAIRSFSVNICRRVLRKKVSSVIYIETEVSGIYHLSP